MQRRLPSYRSLSKKGEAHLRIVGVLPRHEFAPPLAGVARYRVPDTGFSFLQARNPGF